MPLYDYRCPKCHVKEERITKLEEADNQICNCGYLLKRQLSTPVKHGSWSQWQIGLNNRGR